MLLAFVKCVPSILDAAFRFNFTMDVAMVVDVFDLLRVFKVLLKFEFIWEFAGVEIKKLDRIVFKTH